MKLGSLNYQKIKKKYLKFLKSQEVMSEPFRDKLDQLKKLNEGPAATGFDCSTLKSASPP